MTTAQKRAWIIKQLEGFRQQSQSSANDGIIRATKADDSQIERWFADYWNKDGKFYERHPHLVITNAG